MVPSPDQHLENTERRQPFELPPTPFARVLVVDDIREIAWYLGDFLVQRGFEVARAYDGVEAIKSARFFRPHVILLNFMMPRLCGSRALPILRRQPELAGTKIILTSGYPGAKRIASIIGADGFLCTPFSMKDLLAAIASARG